MKNKIDLLWDISLAVIGVASVVLVGSNVIGLMLPDVAVRIIGALDIIALPILISTSVKKSKKN